VLPRVVFFPGASGAADFWAPVADRIPGGWQKRLLSWPGAGAEPHDPAITGYGALVARAAMAVSDGSDVVAQSMGGAIAVGLALAYPGKIRRLVLVATSGGLDVGQLGAEDWRAEYKSAFPHAASWVTQQHVNHTPDLPSIDIPTCLIWGDHDPISPPAVGQALEAGLHRSTLHVITGGTHVMARERPAEIAALIVEHLT
jgi:pimeloyl-ACP methyl ester carboxylesterase